MVWIGDYLERKAFAQHITELLLSRYQAKKSFIANLDAPWGQGKTFFLERLRVDLEAAGFAVAYVNAWRDDRTDDPLVTVLEAIDEAISRKVSIGSQAASTLISAKRKLTPVVAEVGKQIGLHALKLTLGLSVDKVLKAYNADDTYEADDEAIDKGIDAALGKMAGSYVDERLQAQKIARAAIEQFRERIECALMESQMKLPLFVIVDELDRCRPPYAVKMLEEMRHIFAINGVVFLIGTDSLQLSHSIKALYGDQFDSSRYLRRFFDRVITFPPTSRKDLIKAQIAENGMDKAGSFSRTSGLEFSDILRSLFEHQSYSNRDITQFFEIMATFVSSWSEHLPIEPILLVSLIDDYLHAPIEFARSELIIGSSRRNKWGVSVGEKYVNLDGLGVSILQSASNDLRDYNPNWPGREYFMEEFNKRVSGVMTGGPVRSVLASYKDRILLSARLVDQS